MIHLRRQGINSSYTLVLFVVMTFLDISEAYSAVFIVILHIRFKNKYNAREAIHISLTIITILKVQLSIFDYNYNTKGSIIDRFCF